MTETELFIDVNKQIFAFVDEKQALEHIEKMEHPDTKALAKSLWLIERTQRKLAERDQRPRQSYGTE